MAVPKKKRSKKKTRQAKAGKNPAAMYAIGVCPNCGAPVVPHCACGSCGHYNGKVRESVKKALSIS